MNNNLLKRQYWLFIIRPRHYYLNKEKKYRLERGERYQWGCHKDTQRGDGIFFYLTTGGGKQGLYIKYRAKAISNAERVPPEKLKERKEFVWRYRCHIEIQKAHDFPLFLSDIQKEVSGKRISLHPELKDCGVIMESLRRHAFPLKKKEWNCIMRLLEDKSNKAKKTHLQVERCMKRKEVELVGLNKKLSGFHPDENKRVDRAALKFVINKYQSEGWKVTNIEYRNIGYDLCCKRFNQKEHVAVKGLTRIVSKFAVTQNELQAAEEDPDHLFCIVHDALQRKPKEKKYTYKELKEYYNCKPLAYTCKEPL